MAEDSSDTCVPLFIVKCKFSIIIWYSQNFLLAYYICMVILYQTTKFKFANILAIAIFGSTAVQMNFS